MTLGRSILAAACLGGALAASALAQGLPPSPAPGQSGAPSRPVARSAPAPRAEAQPTWAELNAQQQRSLAPLAGTWTTLSAAHKRKWIALSANYATLPPADQALMHSRMAEWAALSPQQRTTARLNFAESKAVPRTDRKAQWEAYQALPAEEKRRLAAGAAAAKPPPPPTAPAVKPVPQQKLAKVPKAKKGEPATKAATTRPVDPNTLLPQYPHNP